MTAAPAGRAAVLGSPIGHSLSPVLHRAAYLELGLDWRYDAFECDEAALPAFLDSAAGFDGLSLTMPLKRAVLPLLDEASPLALAVGAANTVTFGVPDAAGRRVRRGHNTDVPGMVASILGLLTASDATASRVIVLGAGGTAAAAIGACHELGVRAVTVVVRDRGRAADLLAAADTLDVAVDLLDWPAPASLAGATLVISTVPAGAGDALVSGRSNLFRPGQLLFDVLYDPWPTPLASAADRAGALVIGGLELLVQQAGEQVTVMTGHAAPIEVMREAGRKALYARNSPAHDG